MKAEVINEEFECGWYCDPNGCHGHEGRIVGIDLDGMGFYDEDYVNGDSPTDAERVATAASDAVDIINAAARCEQCDRLVRLVRRLVNWDDREQLSGESTVWNDLRRELESIDKGETDERPRIEIGASPDEK